MQSDKDSSTKEFQLPSLPSSKCTASRTATVKKRNNPAHRNSSPSPHRIFGVSSILSDNHTRLKHLIPPYTSAKTWVIYNTLSEAVLFGQGSEDRREIASLTKIMTCYLSLKLAESRDIPLTKRVTISARAARITGTSANLQAGDNLSLIDLLHGLMLPSGNDAAYALAEFFGGLISTEKSVKCFVNEMNKTAEELSLVDTKYKNPHGMSPRPNFSTAKDVSILANISLKNKIFSEIVNEKEYSCTIQNEEPRFVTWKSTNKLLGKGTDGVKTGQTVKAGPCLCVRFTHSKVPLIITVLCCKTNHSRWIEVPRLAAWAYSKLYSI